jgi:hypothetical protein
MQSDLDAVRAIVWIVVAAVIVLGLYLMSGCAISFGSGKADAAVKVNREIGIDSEIGDVGSTGKEKKP